MFTSSGRTNLDHCRELGHKIEVEFIEHFGDKYKGIWYILWFCSCGKYDFKEITEGEFVRAMKEGRSS